MWRSPADQERGGLFVVSPSLRWVIQKRKINQELGACGETHRSPWTNRDLENDVPPRFHGPGRCGRLEAAVEIAIMWGFRD